MVMVTVMGTPTVVLIRTIIMATNAGHTALLPTGTNDQTNMYASPGPTMNG